MDNNSNNYMSNRDHIALQKLDYFTKVSLESIWQEWIEVCKEQHLTGKTIINNDDNTEITNN